MFYAIENFLDRIGDLMDRILGRDTLMHVMIRWSVIFAMVLLTVVSIWTTYVSVKDSILPDPIVTLPLVGSFSFLALLMAFGIGLMLLALKLAIFDDQKRLNIFGLTGLIVIAFISIAFNMDVLYRTANQEFFLNYANNKVRNVYEPYLAQVQAKLVERRDELRKGLAKQETELASEVEGLREQPAGFGPVARVETYRLNLLAASSNVELKSINEALESKQEADQILITQSVESVDDVQKLQTQVRNAAKDAGALAGLPLPPPVSIESPLFAVFSQLFNWKRVGLKEFFFLAIAIFLDLGDIIGYKLVPANKRRPRKRAIASSSTTAKKSHKLPDHLALPSGSEPALMDDAVIDEKFQAYCRSCGFRWNARKQIYKRPDGTVIRKNNEGTFKWELTKDKKVVPIWIATRPLNHPHGVEIPAQIWNQAKAGNAILLEPQNGEFVEMQCDMIRRDVESGRLSSTAVYRLKVALPS